jgi:hypothetical protein
MPLPAPLANTRYRPRSSDPWPPFGCHFDVVSKLPRYSGSKPIIDRHHGNMSRPDRGPELPVSGAFLTTYRLLFAENLLEERVALLMGQLRIGFFFVSRRNQPGEMIRLEQKRCK